MSIDDCFVIKQCLLSLKEELGSDAKWLLKATLNISAESSAKTLNASCSWNWTSKLKLPQHTRKLAKNAAPPASTLHGSFTIGS